MIRFGVFMVSLALLFGCQSNNSSNSPEGGTLSEEDILTGSMRVVVDESVLPLIEEQVAMFESSYTNSKISLEAAPERVAINTLLKGEASVAVLNRELSAEESEGFKKRNIPFKSFLMAYDALVFVTQVTRGDSAITKDAIASMLRGASSSSKYLAFDNVNGSALRYLKEVTNIEKVSGAFVKELGSARQVFEAIRKDEAAIGVMSLNQYLSIVDGLNDLDNIRILALQNPKDGKYYIPSQSTLGDETYPFKQGVYILNYQANMGLGLGFSAFLTSDRGQRIVLRSGILPAKVPGRELIIRDELNL